ncbi:imelysin family protein [Hyunsoonleella sp. 2307UL5-6]|uniref:imelysin family protein n=1 Tax=Hyunsoonleella sp. 2307UL5-6 TaxID=3384768 RepID=UPI0039BD3B88
MKKFFLGLICLGIIVACSSSSTDDDSTGGNDNFDRGALLTNVADNIIIPAFEDLQTKLSALDVARGNFVNDMSQSNLDALSDAWLEAYKVWQYVEMFNIGKAEGIDNTNFIGFVSFFNIYPLEVSDIENGAGTGNYDLTTGNYHDGQGFPALDFLIHGVADSDATALDKFTSNSKKEGYVTYLDNVVARMNTLNNTILNDWKNNYRDTFVTNLSSSTTGSISKIVNDFVFYYERGLRANKIGIPAGNFSNEPLPNKVEAFYKKDVSKLLALEALTAVQDFFNGKTYNESSTGESFKTYLEALGRNDLATTITSKFNEAKQKLEVLDDSFYNQVDTDNTKMTQAYDALQTAVVSLKVDMMGVFQVSLDEGFVDSDGD